jgi:hypothetical protein
MSFAQEMRDFIGAYKAMSSGGPSEAERRRKAQEMPDDFERRHAAENYRPATTPTRSDTTAIPVDTGAAAPETEGETAIPEERETPAYASGGVVQDELTVPTSAGAAQVQAIPEERLAFEGGGIAHQDYFDRLETERGTGRRKPLLSPQDLGDALDLFVKGLSQAGNDGALPVDDGGQGFAAAMMGKGAATPQEVKAMDSVLDPRGRMSPDERAEFRLGAMVKWKLQQGDYRGAMEVAKALSLYSVVESQRYAGMARAAVAAGDDKGAAYYAMKAGQALPDGKRHVVQPMGNGKFRVASVDGYTGKAAPPMTLDRAGMAKMTEAGMVGGIPLKALMSTAAAHRTGDPMGRARRRSSGGSRRSSGAGGGSGSSNVGGDLAPVYSAKAALDAAVAEGDEAKIAAAKAGLATASQKFMSRPFVGRGNPDIALSERRKLLASITGVGGAPATAGGKAPAKGAPADPTDKLAAVRNAAGKVGDASRVGMAIGPDGKRVDMGSETSTGMRPEGPAVEKAARANEPAADALRAKAAGIGYNSAEGRKAFSKDYEDRAKPVTDAITKLSAEGKVDKSGKATNDQSHVLAPDEARRLEDMAVRVLDKTDANPETVVRALYSMMYGNQSRDGQTVDRSAGVRVDPTTGEVVFNGQRFRMTEDDFAQAAAIRGQRAREDSRKLNANAGLAMREDKAAGERIAESERDSWFGSMAETAKKAFGAEDTSSPGGARGWRERQGARDDARRPRSRQDGISVADEEPPLDEPSSPGGARGWRERPHVASGIPDYGEPIRPPMVGNPDPPVQGPPMDDRIDGPRQYRGPLDEPSSPGGVRSRGRTGEALPTGEEPDLAAGGARNWRDLGDPEHTAEGIPEYDTPEDRTVSPGGARNWAEGNDNARHHDRMAAEIRGAEDDAPAEPEERYLLDDLNFYTGAGI